MTTSAGSPSLSTMTIHEQNNQHLDYTEEITGSDLVQLIDIKGHQAVTMPPAEKGSPSTGSGSGTMWLGFVAVSMALVASVWYPVYMLTEELRAINSIKAGNKADLSRPRDCLDIQESGVTGSGQYTVYPGSLRKGIQVYCDMDTEGGGWLVFQQRIDGSLDFARKWGEYQVGFGDIDREFWLGNEFLHLITSQGMYEMRVEMEDYEDERRYAHYRLFSVGSQDTGYRLNIAGYSGDSGDSLSVHDGSLFSTMDRDQDQSEGSCAMAYKGGWWYTNCLSACLNGQYLAGPHESKADGINWYAWHGFNYSLKSTRMMIRPL